MRRYAMRTALLALALICMAAPAYPQQWRFQRSFDSDDLVPQPRLISPTTKEVDLKDKEFLEFAWSPHEGDATRRDYYDFRLYKGHEMVDANLRFKGRVSPRTFTITLSAALFESGQLYTWSLRQVYAGSKKSMVSYSAFTVKR